MKYLITGGLGVMGSLFAKQLVTEGHHVIIIDDGVSKRHKHNEPWGADHEVYRARLGHEYESSGLWDFSELLKSVDYVIHAAASTGIPYSGQDPQDDWNRNVNGTLCLLESLRKVPKPTVILSSVKPYKTDVMPLTAQTLLQADEPYAASKAAQSLMAQAWATSFNLPVVTLRCSNLYGPAACHGPRHGWATWFAIQAALNSTIQIQGDGEQKRDLLFWTDLLEAVKLAFRLRPGSIYNVGGGEPNVRSVNGVVKILRKHAHIHTSTGPGRRFEDREVFVLNEAFHEATGWVPQVSPPDGLKAIFDWAFANRGTLRGVYEEYL